MERDLQLNSSKTVQLISTRGNFLQPSPEDAVVLSLLRVGDPT